MSIARLLFLLCSPSLSAAVLLPIPGQSGTDHPLPVRPGGLGLGVEGAEQKITPYLWAGYDLDYQSAYKIEEESG